MKIVDTKGHKCPVPLIMAKKALKEINDGENLKVITDNEISLSNLKRFLSDTGAEFTVQAEGDIHTITVTGGGEDIEATVPEEYCEVITSVPAAGKDYSIIFSTQQMGEGNEDLGLILTKSFLITLLELEGIPRSVLFYNSGVKLAADDSFVIDQLRELEKKGVKLLLCGTCVSFYNIGKEITIGTISNMYEMVEEMITASKIIKP